MRYLLVISLFVLLGCDHGVDNRVYFTANDGAIDLIIKASCISGGVILKQDYAFKGLRDKLQVNEYMEKCLNETKKVINLK